MSLLQHKVIDTAAIPCNVSFAAEGALYLMARFPEFEMKDIYILYLLGQAASRGIVNADAWSTIQKAREVAASLPGEIELACPPAEMVGAIEREARTPYRFLTVAPDGSRIVICGVIADLLAEMSRRGHRFYLDDCDGLPYFSRRYHGDHPSVISLPNFMDVSFPEWIDGAVQYVDAPLYDWDNCRVIPEQGAAA